MINEQYIGTAASNSDLPTHVLRSKYPDRVNVLLGGELYSIPPDEARELVRRINNALGVEPITEDLALVYAKRVALVDDEIGCGYVLALQIIETADLKERYAEKTK